MVSFSIKLIASYRKLIMNFVHNLIKFWKQWILFTFHDLIFLRGPFRIVVIYSQDILPLMNRFNQTEAAIFFIMYDMLPEDLFDLFQIILKFTTADIKYLCGGCKKSPQTLSQCSFLLLILWSFGIILYISFSENRIPLKPVLGGVSGIAISITTGEQLQSNRSCYFLYNVWLASGGSCWSVPDNSKIYYSWY